MLQLFSLFLVIDDECVQEARASNLELGAIRVLLDLDAFGVFPSCLQEEVLEKNNVKFLF